MSKCTSAKGLRDNTKSNNKIITLIFHDKILHTNTILINIYRRCNRYHVKCVDRVTRENQWRNQTKCNCCCSHKTNSSCLSVRVWMFDLAEKWIDNIITTTACSSVQFLTNNSKREFDCINCLQQVIDITNISFNAEIYMWIFI